MKAISLTKTVRFIAFGLVIAAFAVSSAVAQEVIPGHKLTNYNITEEMVIEAQKKWAESLLKISKTHMESGDYRKVASEEIDKGYNYANGIVLFKPTLTTGDQTFRLDKEGAMAYFVGGNSKYKNDTGFALKGWVGYKTKNAGIIVNGTVAVTTGNIYLYDKAGNETVVDKTWGFKMDEYGKLKIFLHHSSLPYKPAK